MVTIGIYQWLSNSELYEHRCLERIKKLYKSAGKCDDQQQYKSIIVAAIVSTPYGFTDNSKISPGPYVTVKYNSARKLLRQFTEFLDVKQETDVRRLGVVIYIANGPWGVSES